MRFVDHDPAAARHAAACCRTAADELRRVAGWLELRPRCTAWSGGAREATLTDLELLAFELRREATRYDHSADALEAAAWAAVRAEAVAVAAHRERQRRVRVCQPAGAVAVGAP